ncbi:hypothetical protein COLO4_02642 [Corchorus olitorius]|uniref:Uncharacterized protein n=1 Tax=Corchorus olitorius TaxID=93759 RepID=A0A1R3L0Q4_9ROSI|nr:hypothetical protein COLO4_02642 [Corchorus olitorius]
MADPSDTLTPSLYSSSLVQCGCFRYRLPRVSVGR